MARKKTSLLERARQETPQHEAARWIYKLRQEDAEVAAEVEELLAAWLPEDSELRRQFPSLRSLHAWLRGTLKERGIKHAPGRCAFTSHIERLEGKDG